MAKDGLPEIYRIATTDGYGQAIRTIQEALDWLYSYQKNSDISPSLVRDLEEVIEILERVQS